MDQTTDQELSRMKQLAGIEEDNGVSAYLPGNTAHKPTDQLRARLRRKNEKKGTK